MRFHTHSLGLAAIGLLLSFGAVASAAENSPVLPMPAVAVVRTPTWSQGDPAKEGAAELAILMQIARLQCGRLGGGLVAVGDRRGLFSEGAEEALRQAVLRGVPVVKLAESGRVLPAPHDLFVDGGSLSEDEASRVLARCLARYGALPTKAAQRRERLQLFQQEFARATGTRLAGR